MRESNGHIGEKASHFLPRLTVENKTGTLVFTINTPPTRKLGSVKLVGYLRKKKILVRNSIGACIYSECNDTIYA